MTFVLNVKILTKIGEIRKHCKICCAYIYAVNSAKSKPFGSSDHVAYAGPGLNFVLALCSIDTKVLLRMQKSQIQNRSRPFFGNFLQNNHFW